MIEIDDGATSNAGSTTSTMVIDIVDGEEVEDKENQKPSSAGAAAASASANPYANGGGGDMPVLDLRQLTSRSGQGKRAPRQGELRSAYELRVR